MQYEIVDRASCPAKWGKWRALFDPLPFDKAVKILCESRGEARRKGASISGSLRRGRAPYTTAYRTVPDGEGKILLYVWKSPRKEGGIDD